MKPPKYITSFSASTASLSMQFKTVPETQISHHLDGQHQHIWAPAVLEGHHNNTARRQDRR